MSSIHPSTEETLRKELGSLGAREFEVVALSLVPDRGLAALRYAVERGADHPISYAVKLFDNPDWSPKGETKRLATNVFVDSKCTQCGGDRFVLVTDGPGMYEETYAPCASCNANANTEFWTQDGRKFVSAAR